MPHYEPWSEERAQAVIGEFAHLEGPLMPMLHAVQETFGHVPDAVFAGVRRAEIERVRKVSEPPPAERSLGALPLGWFREERSWWS